VTVAKGVTDGIRVAENAMEPLRLDRSPDPVVVDAEPPHLLTRDHTVLTRGEIGEGGLPGGVPFGRYAPIRRTAADLAPLL